MVDTLDPGGLERLACDVANLLPRARYRSSLCTTRRSGELARGLSPEVSRLDLARRWRFDPLAIARLRHFLSRHQIAIIHAHGHSLLPAVLAATLCPRTAVVWHVHSGAWSSRRPPRSWRLATRRVAFTFTVTEALARWCTDTLALAPARVAYLPNFLPVRPSTGALDPALPACMGKRLVCVANLRPEKDLATLVAAMARLVRQRADVQLLIAGRGDAGARAELDRTITAAGLGAHVTCLGHRRDIPALLQACDAAVLSSRSEGFPLALLEYGAAGLPVAATRVGQCAEILDHGRAGLLVAPRDPPALAAAMARLLGPAGRALGRRLTARVAERYAPAAILERICACYARVAQHPLP